MEQHACKLSTSGTLSVCGICMNFPLCSLLRETYFQSLSRCSRYLAYLPTSKNYAEYYTKLPERPTNRLRFV
ncbi:hypothetical protein PUN28_010645 [Cardiocondyla obscurior]|uniref:Uncharacterized protein n=1 Tax=Cardiocondyla obscurior TaxID=286306 RepID=A0AAW2FI82_9HYME